ncbi:uncharacterized protein LOC122312037 isoform X2 [Carya illinoinensis]|uniref:uncharacterized protein LOC122312037 isoform X2 n=1 Tax=Carya illinoinensis TaxID=32201 RepID=UPI001C71CAA8|nr:uncharacterized protein LOC122312037 isoform X2 [Carya illinoinensis]
MVRSVRRGVRGRGGGFGGIFVQRPELQDEPSPLQNVPTLRDDTDDSSDDSTQPPDVVFETEFPEQQDPSTAVSKKQGRGRAKMTKFDMLRKIGLIPLLIKEGDTKVSCENANVFSGRVTWIIKHYANMGYQRWNDVPEAEQEELCARVRADFIIQWEKPNHRKTITEQLHRRFNSFHYDLHKIYLEYGSHKVAVARGTSMVDEAVWRKLCMRWGSKEFKVKSCDLGPCHCKTRRIEHYNEPTILLAGSPLFEYWPSNVMVLLIWWTFLKRLVGQRRKMGL